MLRTGSGAPDPGLEADEESVAVAGPYGDPSSIIKTTYSGHFVRAVVVVNDV